MAASRVRYTAEERTGVMLVLLEDLLWGLFPVITNWMVSGCDPLLAAAVSSLAASLPFLAILAWRGQLPLLVQRGVRGRLVLIALFSQVFASVCFFIGASRTSAINASLLGQVEPIYSIVLAWWLLKERVTGGQLAATLLLVSGAVAVMFDGSFVPRSGDLLILATPLGYQLGHTLAKRLFQEISSPLVVPAMRLGLGGVILLGLALARDPGQVSSLGNPVLMGRLAAFGLLFIGLEKFIWYEAIRRIDLAKATALLVPSVGVGLVGSFLLLGERPGAGQLVGFLLMVAGLVKLTAGRMTTSAPGPSIRPAAERAARTDGMSGPSEEMTGRGDMS